jgi:NADH-quinone oxidoreductase subunit N
LKNKPLLAAILTGSLLSMAGIPIFAGFLLLFLFDQMIQSGFIALVIVVINSIISVGYYFKIIVAMYNKESNEERTGTPFVIYGSCCCYGIEYCARCFPSFVLDLLA